MMMTGLAAASVLATDGWKLPPRQLQYPDNSKVWFAPVKDGEKAFEIKKLDGAEGSVRFEGDTIHVEKTNDKGAILVRTAIPSSLMPKTRRFRASVETEASVSGSTASRGYIRMGRLNADGMIDNDRAADGRSINGRLKLDQLISTPPGRPQLKAAHFNRDESESGRIYTSICVDGAASESRWRNWRIDSVTAVVKANTAARKNAQGRDFTGDMTDPKLFEAKLAGDFEHTAKVVVKDGCTRLTVDGREVPPILFKGKYHAGGELMFGGKRMHEAGFPLMVAFVRLGQSDIRKGAWTTNGFNAAMAVDEVRRAMLTAPDALYAVTLRMDAPIGWCDTRTNEIWRTRTGDAVYGDGMHVLRGARKGDREYWPWVSYHSRVWRDEVKKVLAEFVAELKKTGLSKRIVGIHISGYHDSQFAAPVPDWSQPARRAFAKSGETDYARFLKRSSMELQDDLAGHIRRLFGKQIIVMRWCMAAFGHGFCSAHDIRDFVDSKQIDIIVPQPSYGNRSPGYAVGVKLPFSSFHLHGKLLMHEHDLRTYASWSAKKNAVQDAGVSRAADIDEWRTVNHKMAGMMLARRTGYWYYDMESGWYDTPEIAADIAGIIKLARPLCRKKPDSWRPTAALVIDEEDLLDLQDAEAEFPWPAAPLNPYVEHIAASGVPFDVYLKSDFANNSAIASRYRYVIDYNRSTPAKTPAQINAEAKAAGAYVPLPPDKVQVDMSGDFISVHCLVPGKYDFILPRKCKVVNAKSNLAEPVAGKVLPLEMEAGQTSWFLLQ
jgi:hypothetical protein